MVICSCTRVHVLGDILCGAVNLHSCYTTGSSAPRGGIYLLDQREDDIEC